MERKNEGITNRNQGRMRSVDKEKRENLTEEQERILRERRRARRIRRRRQERRRKLIVLGGTAVITILVLVSAELSVLSAKTINRIRYQRRKKRVHLLMQQKKPTQM